MAEQCSDQTLVYPANLSFGPTAGAEYINNFG